MPSMMKFYPQSFVNFERHDQFNLVNLALTFSNHRLDIEIDNCPIRMADISGIHYTWGDWCDLDRVPKDVSEKRNWTLTDSSSVRFLPLIWAMPLDSDPDTGIAPQGSVFPSLPQPGQQSTIKNRSATLATAYDSCRSVNLSIDLHPNIYWIGMAESPQEINLRTSCNWFQLEWIDTFQAKANPL